MLSIAVRLATSPARWPPSPSAIGSAASAPKNNGDPCNMQPMRDEVFCFAHHPDHAQEAAEARRLGGQRRRREHAIAGAFDVEGIETIGDIRRVLDIVVIDGLALENSVARLRVLISACSTAARLREVADLEERLASLESALRPTKKRRGTR
jgi:hypothetical protein